jgi:acetyl esterase/lipase
MYGATPHHVTQVLYRVAPRVDFAQIVVDLSEVIASVFPSRTTVRWDRANIAIIESDAARMIFGVAQMLPGEHSVCITSVVGQSPLSGAKALSATDQDLLSRTIFAAIDGLHPADEKRSFETWSALDAALIDHLTEALKRGDGPKGQTTGALHFGSSEHDGGADLVPAEPLDMGRMMHRLSAELTTGATGLISRAIASATALGARLPIAPGEDKDGANANSVPVAPPRVKLHARVFSRKAPNNPLTPNMPPAPQTSTTDLLALRRALYGPDFSRRDGIGPLVVQTRRILQQIAVLGRGRSSGIGSKEKPHGSAAKDDSRNA